MVGKKITRREIFCDVKITRNSIFIIYEQSFIRIQHCTFACICGYCHPPMAESSSCVRDCKTHQFSSVQFSHSVVSDSLRPHESQHARPPSPSPTPGVHSDSRPSSQWCHPAISSSVVPFTSCPQSFLAPGSFQMSQLFASGGQSIGVSASTSVLPMKTQDWPPLGWTV